MIITTNCDHPDCPGTVRFRHDAVPRKNGHLLGSCDACRGRFTLYAGQVRPALPRREERKAVERRAS